jgi:hypothetical protein
MKINTLVMVCLATAFVFQDIMAMSCRTFELNNNQLEDSKGQHVKILANIDSIVIKNHGKCRTIHEMAPIREGQRMTSYFKCSSGDFRVFFINEMKKDSIYIQAKNVEKVIIGFRKEEISVFGPDPKCFPFLMTMMFGVIGFYLLLVYLVRFDNLQ